MTRNLRRRVWGAAVLLGGCLVAGCGDEVQVGALCPSPYLPGGGATVEPGPDGGTTSILYGTSCAPCAPDDDVHLDDRGCPIYVPAAACGGAVCLFGQEISLVSGGADDAGAEEDAGE